MGMMLGGAIVVFLVSGLVYDLIPNRKIAIIVGLCIIILVWLAMEIWVYSACLKCRQNPLVGDLCCEWTGVGMLAYSIIALCTIFAFIVYVLVADRS